MSDELPKNKIADLKKALHKLNELRQRCERAENAGLECQGYYDELDALEKQLMGLYQTYVDVKKQMDA